MSTHYWVRADRGADCERLAATLDRSPVLAKVDAHRRLRGPYTAAGSLLRLIGADALRKCPELGPRHRIELQQSTPELRGMVPPMEFDISKPVKDQTRYQARLHTFRLSHGIVEFVDAYLQALGGARTLIVTNAHEADPTDREFLAVLLRRIDPARLTVVVCTDRADLLDPPGPAPASLVQALAKYATTVDGPPTALNGSDGAVESDPGELARKYVDSDGTSDDPRLRLAYEQLPLAHRARLHDERAATLATLDEPSLLLGAVPYHLERGGNPAGAGVKALRHAQQYCRLLGFYHTAADFGLRGRVLVDPASEWELWWRFTADMVVSLASAGRAAEAEKYVEEVRQKTTDPTVQMHLAYELGMLYTRHFEDDRRDHDKARGFLNLAISISSLLEDPRARVYHSVFNKNGLALVEVRQGRLAEAVRLVTEGMARMDRELAPDDYRPHRIGLRYNRAQVYGMIGRLDDALTDYTAVIEVDHFFPDHYFNRGNILRRMGRAVEAVADYTSALGISPPFHEAYYNRADARLELGDIAGALGDFSRVLDLDPANTDARLNRASILCELGDTDAALRDVLAGLDDEPANPLLLTLHGRLLAERGDHAASRAALTAALGTDGNLAEAWALLGELDYQSGDLASAANHFDKAVALGGTVEMLFNRAVVYQAARRFPEAVADYDAVLAMSDDEEAKSNRDHCRRLIEQQELVAESS